MAERVRLWCPRCSWHRAIDRPTTRPLTQADMGWCEGGPWTSGHDAVAIEPAPPLQLRSRVDVTPQLSRNVLEQFATVASIEGRITLNGSDPMYAQQRKAVELVVEERQRAAERELRRLVRRGVVSPFQLDREFGYA